MTDATPLAGLSLDTRSGAILLNPLGLLLRRRSPGLSVLISRFRTVRRSRPIMHVRLYPTMLVVVIEIAIGESVVTVLACLLRTAVLGLGLLN